MRKLLMPLTIAALAALAAASTAAAKGPTAASLTGPGLGHAISIGGASEGGAMTPLGILVQHGGFFPQVFRETPDPVSWKRPSGDLGPRYRIAYAMPGPSGSASIAQDIYPYAKPNPVSYMAKDQHFWGSERTHGGWYVATPALKTALLRAGLPASPPTAPSGSWPWKWTGLGVAALVVLLLVALRRRHGVQLRTLKSTA
jgi:MYXO-CTERM domain-containing protein